MVSMKRPAKDISLYQFCFVALVSVLLGTLYIFALGSRVKENAESGTLYITLAEDDERAEIWAQIEGGDKLAQADKLIREEATFRGFDYLAPRLYINPSSDETPRILRFGICGSFPEE